MNVTNTANIAKAIASGTWRPNIYLTNVSIAQFQRPDDFVAYKLFPIVPVDQPTSKFYRFSKADLARVNMDRKPAFGTVNPAVWSQDEGNYTCEVYQGLYGVDQISARPFGVAGAPGVADPMVAKARIAAEQTKLFMDLMFAKKFFKAGAWTIEYSGVSTTPSGQQFWQFDNANADPISFVDGLKTDLKREGRRTPNKMALGAETYNGLKHNPTILERIKYSGSSANPATVNQNVLAQLFGVDEVLVMESTYNSAPQGAAANMQYVCDPKGMLLCYTTSAPAIDEPSAGYIFAWDMLGAGQHMAVTNFQGAPGTHSEFVEALCAFDMQQVSTDLAVYCKNCVA